MNDKKTFGEFVPDLYIVIVGGAIVAYGTGLCKIVYITLHFKIFKHPRFIKQPMG